MVLGILQTGIDLFLIVYIFMCNHRDKNYVGRTVENLKFYKLSSDPNIVF